MVITCNKASRSERKNAVSIFDRLISTLKGEGEAAVQSPTKAHPSAQEANGSSRFMGRDGAESSSQKAAPVVEQGLEGPAMIWLHVQPATQHLLLVPDLGVAEGEEMSAKMLQDLRRAGLCEEVAYHASYDQYWKMPSQEAILRTPTLFDIPTPFLNRVKLETRLVKQGEPRGFWMRVKIRPASELDTASAEMV